MPFDPEEDAASRHERRLVANLERGEAELRAWCLDNALDLEIKNQGHHWIFTGPPGWVAEWWPSSAKLVLCKRWERGIHVHDWTQAKRELARSLERKDRQ